MSNKFFNNQNGPNLTAPSQAATDIPKLPPLSNPGMPMRTAPWPGLPGKAGPARNAGVKKINIYPTSKGL